MRVIFYNVNRTRAAKLRYAY